MPVICDEHQYIDARRHAPEWRRVSRQALVWKSWQDLERPTAFEGLPFSSESLNSEIDKLYDELARLIASRQPNYTDPKLEEKIQLCFQRLRELQKREGDLVRGMLALRLAGPIAKGGAVLKRAKEVMENYENPASADTPPRDSNTQET